VVYKQAWSIKNYRYVGDVSLIDYKTRRHGKMKATHGTQNNSRILIRLFTT
jgi:hypothetical protein